MKKLLAHFLILVCLVSMLGNGALLQAQAAPYYDTYEQLIKLQVGDTYQIPTSKPVRSWSSSNRGIVDVDDSGMITAVAYYSNTIFIKATYTDDSYDSFEVRVVKNLLSSRINGFDLIQATKMHDRVR